MNLYDSSFLCLDIGTYGVRGIAHRVHNAQIDRSAFFTIDSADTIFAIKSVIDELERQIGAHFDSAYITGNLGQSAFDMTAKSTTWSGEHKISNADIRNQISQITHLKIFSRFTLYRCAMTHQLRATCCPLLAILTANWYRHLVQSSIAS